MARDIESIELCLRGHCCDIGLIDEYADAIRLEALNDAFIRLCKRLGIDSKTGYIIDRCKRIEASNLCAAILGKEDEK